MVIITVCPIAFIFIDVDNADIFEILWHQLLLPDNADEPCEVTYNVVTTLLLDLFWNALQSR